MILIQDLIHFLSVDHETLIIWERFFFGVVSNVSLCLLLRWVLTPTNYQPLFLVRETIVMWLSASIPVFDLSFYKLVLIGNMKLSGSTKCFKHGAEISDAWKHGSSMIIRLICLGENGRTLVRWYRKCKEACEISNPNQDWYNSFYADRLECS